MNCNVHVFCKLIFSIKFGFILETSLFLYDLYFQRINNNTNANNFTRMSAFFLYMMSSKEKKMFEVLLFDAIKAP